MKLAYLRFRALAVVFGVAAVGAPASGCILTPEDDDAGAGTDPSGPSGPVSNSASDPSVTQSGTGDPTSNTSPSTSNDTTDSGMLPEGCSENLFGDPGFEAGTPSDAWVEVSAVFGTPICDAGCTEQPGAAPYDGDWWVWFGGIEQQENASVSQSVTIDPTQGILQFRFWINTGAGMGNDVFAVDIDGMNVFMATDVEVADYDSYGLIEVDISDFADGMEHTITFSAEITGVGLTNFFLDDALLVSCAEGMGTTSDPMTTAGTTMQMTTAETMAEATGTGMTDTDTDSGTTAADTGTATM